MSHHQPVLPDEVTAYLKCGRGGDYIDCTLGGGGHAARILEESSPSGKLLGIDWDREAIRIARQRLRSYTGRVIFVRDNYTNLKTIVRTHRFGPVDGILLDLGISSFQLEDSNRGFSFREEGPLDMRMDPDNEVTASELINRLPVRGLEHLLRDYGEERWARKISQYVGKFRKADPITTTRELRRIVHAAIPPSARSQRIDPATRTFMALRIAVNKELDNLRTVVREAAGVLKRGGRICIISFHSLEDRMVKDYFRTAEKGCTCPPRLPQCLCQGEKTLQIVTRKPVTPSKKEMDQNPRARSAKLRVAERV